MTARSSGSRLLFNFNRNDIQDLLAIHEILTGEKRGKRPQFVSVLNKSAIVLITACWEAYVEDIVAEAFRRMLTGCKDAKAFPAKVRALASETLRKHQDATKVWELAGEGWKHILSEHKDKVLEGTLARFHSPNPENVELLFEQVIGLKNLSAQWKWRRMTPEDAWSKLDFYVHIRGQIAHGTLDRPVIPKRAALDYFNHVKHLVEATDHAVAEHVRRVTGASPW